MRPLLMVLLMLALLFMASRLTAGVPPLAWQCAGGHHV